MASVGGLLGLIAGLSAISFVELAFHLIRLLIKIFSGGARVYPDDRQDNVLPSFRRRQFLVNRDHVPYKCSNFVMEYMKASSIHGFSYIINRRTSLIEKTFVWLSCVVASAVFCIIFIVDTVKNAELNPIIFKIDNKFWSVEKVSLKKEDYLRIVIV